jgi:hypothetical protein
VRKPLATLAALAVSAPLAIALMGSDHKDGPNATADHAADIADLYAWHDAGTGTFTAVLTFAGFDPAGHPATYDPNVLYTIHIDRADTAAHLDQASDVDIQVRFARNDRGEWGVQVENLPGASGAIAGKVETVLNGGGKRKVYAGLRDDPFFFDLDGFKATIAKPAADSTLLFDHTHDTFAGFNVTAVVIEMDLADVTVNGTLPHLQLWATSGRKPQANASVAPRRADDHLLAKR